MGIEKENQKKVEGRILVVTAVQPERDAVLRGLQGNPRFEVVAAGVGPAATAAGTARLLALSEYELVVSAGIGGGFAGCAPVGSIVLATRIIAADLGAETPQGFCSVDQLGFGASSIEVESKLMERLVQGMKAAALTVTTGPVLTVSTVTGTAESCRKLITRVPGAVGEAMEGYGVAVAAQGAGVPVLELRAISNLVGPREREVWKIKEALESLTAASKILAEVLS